MPAVQLDDGCDVRCAMTLTVEARGPTDITARQHHINLHLNSWHRKMMHGQYIYMNLNVGKNIWTRATKICAYHFSVSIFISDSEWEWGRIKKIVTLLCIRIKNHRFKASVYMLLWGPKIDLLYCCAHRGNPASTYHIIIYKRLGEKMQRSKRQFIINCGRTLATLRPHLNKSRSELHTNPVLLMKMLF